MARRTDIITPDSVEVTYELAGVGSRFVALFVDTLIQALLLAAMAFLFWLMAALLTAAHLFGSFFATSWGVAVGVLFVFLVWWGYYPLFETIWSGQTPGKRYAGIRVLRDGGFPLDFRAALIRNLVRVADVLPGVYGVGGACVLFHPGCKRLGDMAAGTIVVRERQEEEPVKSRRPAHLPGAEVRSGETTPAPGPVDLSMAPLESLSRGQLQGIRRFLDRRGELDLATQQTLAQKIAEPLLGTLNLTEQDIGLQYSEFLAQVVETFETQQATRLDL